MVFKDKRNAVDGESQSNNNNNDSVSVAGTSSVSLEDAQDDIQVIRDSAKQETSRVTAWRFIVAGCLLVAAIVVTVTTYQVLHTSEVDSFESAYEQFARTVETAVIDQQKTLRTSFRQLATTYSIYVESSDESWPMATIPHFVAMTDTTLKEVRMEWANVYHRVTLDQKDAWLNYMASNYKDMVKQGHVDEHGSDINLIPVGYDDFMKKLNLKRLQPGGSDEPIFIPDDASQEFWVSYEHSGPLLTYGMSNYNIFGTSLEIRDDLLEFHKDALFFPITSSNDIPPGVAMSSEEHEKLYGHFGDDKYLHSNVLFPIYEDPNDTNSRIVAALAGGGAWDSILHNLLPEGVNGIYVVLENSCEQAFTYVINGESAEQKGEGDLHDAAYNEYEVAVDMSFTDNFGTEQHKDHCEYKLSIYPSSQFEEDYLTTQPEIFVSIIAVIFVVIMLAFFVFDMLVNRRNEMLVENAALSNAIVSSIFPRQIRALIYQENDSAKNANKDAKGIHHITDLKSYLNGISDSSATHKKPLANLFMETSVLFADIARFTTWSAVHEPSQVFTFLETLFSSFDQIAKASNVFKVETVGDCYVAATGIPEPTKDHAVVMVRFARNILTKMQRLVNDLKVTHGPGTGDLSLRIGIHSGPVTAGVLRGERPRFQLFGETMNTAARVEHTGQVGRIQISCETAEALKLADKSHWLIKRKRTIELKGKGNVETYWIQSELDTKETGRPSAAIPEAEQSEQPDAADDNGDEAADKADAIRLDVKTNRLVNWNNEMLLQILRQILARREAMKATTLYLVPNKQTGVRDSQTRPEGDFLPLEEVKDIIYLPEFDSGAFQRQRKPKEMDVSPQVVDQLRSLVAMIASMYSDHAFHNFEHASHVTMSVIKLLARIVAPTGAATGDDPLAVEPTDHTFGVTSDPLTQFAVAFAALIHDVDHCGVPNTQLVKEKVRLAEIYGNKSVAEQNSFVVSWDLFMSDQFKALRQSLCPTADELNRFRQLVVNSVMATDILDRGLGAARNGRWEKAFNDDNGENLIDATNRKATIIIEHLIQASDVSHTMQHWHVYRKWNERFFRECHKAYKDGRADKDPTDGWFADELRFFDMYIIPLTMKLKESGVFGKSSDEYLNYALANRKEWETRGQEVIDSALAAIEQERLEGQGQSKKMNDRTY